jgi:hypothetical protein
MLVFDQVSGISVKLPADRPDLGGMVERLKQPLKVRYGEPRCG